MEKKVQINIGLKKSSRINRGIIITILVIYSLVTIIPFYFLFVRSFVPTSESAKVHLWIPENIPFNLDAKFGNMATYYNLDVDRFKKDMGITGYINMNISIADLGKKYSIPEEELRSYFQPYYLYNGWINMLQSKGFYRSFIATICITILTVVLGAILGSATGLGLSSFSRRWQRSIYIMYLFQMVVPGVITMLPSYIIVRSLGLTNTYMALLLGSVSGGATISGGAISTMIFTNAAAGIPKEIRESVKIDGGGLLTYYWYFLLPLIKPAIGAYALITIPQVWNSLLASLLYNNPDKYLIMPFISSFANTYSTNYQAIYSGLILALLPLLVLYLLLQKLFVRAALSGSIKG